MHACLHIRALHAPGGACRSRCSPQACPAARSLPVDAGLAADHRGAVLWELALPCALHCHHHQPHPARPPASAAAGRGGRARRPVAKRRALGCAAARFFHWPMPHELPEDSLQGYTPLCSGRSTPPSPQQEGRAGGKQGSAAQCRARHSAQSAPTLLPWPPPAAPPGAPSWRGLPSPAAAPPAARTPPAGCCGAWPASGPAAGGEGRDQCARRRGRVSQRGSKARWP